MHNKYQFKITFLIQLFWLKRAPLKGNSLYKIMEGAIFFQISEKGTILKMSLGNPVYRPNLKNRMAFISKILIFIKINQSEWPMKIIYLRIYKKLFKKNIKFLRYAPRTKKAKMSYFIIGSNTNPINQN